MTLGTYTPWTTLTRLHDELDRLAHVTRNRRDTAEPGLMATHWVPAVDIREEPDRFVLLADVPGTDPKDIDITLEQDVLTLKGERRAGETAEQNGYRRIERSHGTFHRRFTLPETADADSIVARTHNGVLEVSIAKREAVKPRRIEVGQ